MNDEHPSVQAVLDLVRRFNVAIDDLERILDAWDQLDVTDKMWLGQSDTYERLAGTIVQAGHE